MKQSFFMMRTLLLNHILKDSQCYVKKRLIRWSNWSHLAMNEDENSEWTLLKNVRSKIFHEADYEWYSSRSKLWLIDIMKFIRLQWCKNWVHWDFTTESWDQVIYTDETSVILSEFKDRKRVTRKQNKKWNSMCLEKIFKEYSTFMFWEFIALNWKRSCYIYRSENKKKRAVFITALAAADVLRKSLN